MRINRKSAPKVKNGKVQRKNRWRTEPNYRSTHQVRVERETPWTGYRHFVSPGDVTAFLGLLPDWNNLAIGLDRVLLDDHPWCLGGFHKGTVAICAWPEGCARLFNLDFYAANESTLMRLRIPARRVAIVKSCPNCSDEPKTMPMNGVEAICISCGIERIGLDEDETTDMYNFEKKRQKEGAETSEVPAYLVDFTPKTVHAYLLVSVLVHEIGHHHDLMTSPKQRKCTRGEAFAEAYALNHEEAIWRDYCRAFGQ